MYFILFHKAINNNKIIHVNLIIIILTNYILIIEEPNCLAGKRSNSALVGSIHISIILLLFLICFFGQAQTPSLYQLTGTAETLWSL